MLSPVVLCADGSDLSMEALAAGLTLIGQSADRVVIVTAVDELDPTLVVGSGHAGPVMTDQEFAVAQESAARDAASVIARTQSRLGIGGCDSRVLSGPAGVAICQLADEIAAAAIVIGSRGRGGWKRAVLGSVSDYVVRNAPCPVVVANSSAGGD